MEEEGRERGGGEGEGRRGGRGEEGRERGGG